MEFMSLEEEEERWGLLFLLPHEKYRGCLSARRWVLNRLSACSPSQPLELWEINVCCLKCFICVFDAFVKAFRIEEDTGWEIAFRKGVKLCLEKRVANPSSCVTCQLCRAKVRPLLGSSSSGFFSLGSAATYYVWQGGYLLTQYKGDKTWANGVKLSRTYGIRMECSGSQPQSQLRMGITLLISHYKPVQMLITCLTTLTALQPP